MAGACHGLDNPASEPATKQRRASRLALSMRGKLSSPRASGHEQNDFAQGLRTPRREGEVRLSVTGLDFLIALFAAAGAYTFLPALWMRRVFISACGAVFLWFQAPTLLQAGILLAFVLSGYGAARLLRWRPSSLLLTAYILALTAAFLVLKRYAFLRLVGGDTLIAHAIDLVGLSFILFRQIHYVVDAKQGQIPKLDLWGYLCFQLNPFTLLAGPIQRYQVFHEDWQRLEPLQPDAHALRLTALRILVGVFKVAFLAEFCLWLATTAFWVRGADGPSLQQMLALFYAYPAYVYLNFAGYCDIVIAGASLFGLRLPENFDRPYLARNMIDFWSRWHRSLSFWIRDYVFTPLYMTVARARADWAPHLAFVCYFVALFLAGVWHGSTWNFVVFGALNGIGVAGTKLWENIIVAQAGRKGLRAYLASEPIKWAARIATFHFVCVTQVFLRPGTEDNVAALVRIIASALGMRGG
jgi:D-alanyl-lipoteichoic acid acyltransferase DltB (MBOAT superfamily)